MHRHTPIGGAHAGTISNCTYGHGNWLSVLPFPTDPPLEGATPWDAFLACLHFYKCNYKKYLAKFEKK